MAFIEVLKAIILGIIEGITEWLPVSSTGHMLLVDEFLKLDVSEQFRSLFMVVIQLGAILAVVVIYWKEIWPFGIKAADEYDHAGGKRISISKRKIIMWLKIIVACVPAAIIGILFDEKFEELFYHPIPIALALIVIGVLFLFITEPKGNREVVKISQLTYKDAIIIGIWQLLAAIFPGTSRSGATIIGALLLGVSKKIAAEFTFYLAIPVMFGASLLKIVKFIKDGFSATGTEITMLLVGMVVAFIVSVIVIKFLMSFIKKHSFKAFGVYRIILGLIIIGYFGFIHK
ncbi:MAG TPA: undecaprenyl-diphosphatase [Lachnospiraceae bacterium]|nr:undecaprenyl-diphosphatase [Lachnospiraceae bacterium]HBZ90370.1 undecaprenyl-diphosphatase [Lachnospiraceae bacterium]